MATKLKNLKVTKVDFVDEGANPDAHIKLYKNREGEPGGEPKQQDRGNIWKRLFGIFAKADDSVLDELGDTVEQIEKEGAHSFDDQMQERKTQRIADEIWDVCYALEASLCSILHDVDLDSASASNQMQESLDEFYGTMKESIGQWSAGKATGISKSDDEITEDDLEIAKSAKERLEAMIEKAYSGDAPEDKDDNEKGEEDMDIDKSKMTPSERAFYEDIVKRCSGGEGEQVPTEPGSSEGAVAKALDDLGLKAPEANVNDQEDIYKGVNPELKAEIEELRKFRQDAEDKELHDIAKRYEILGKTEDEMFPVLKNAKAAGGTVLDDLVAVLDQSKATIEKSGAFSEIGKTGGHEPVNDSAWDQAEAKAVDLMKSRTGITKAQALDQVLQDDPELAKKCDEEG